jgi:hypothetical protein
MSVFYNEEFYLLRYTAVQAGGSQLTTWHYIPQDKLLHAHSCENLKSNTWQHYWDNIEQSINQNLHQEMEKTHQKQQHKIHNLTKTQIENTTTTTK